MVAEHDDDSFLTVAQCRALERACPCVPSVEEQPSPRSW